MLNKKIVGVFPMAADLLHSGHISALEEAKNHCDYLIVGLNCCPTKGNPTKHPTIQSVFERFNQLKAVKYVDEIVPYEDESDLLVFLGSTNYQIRFVGDDYKDRSWTGKLVEDERGIKPHFLSRQYHGLSSTELKARVVMEDNKFRCGGNKECKE